MAMSRTLACHTRQGFINVVEMRDTVNVACVSMICAMASGKAGYMVMRALRPKCSSEYQ